MYRLHLSLVTVASRKCVIPMTLYRDMCLQQMCTKKISISMHVLFDKETAYTVDTV